MKECGIMNAIQSLIDEVISDEAKLSVLFRKIFSLPSDIQYEELKNWAKKESNGYSSEEQIPDYRKIGVHNLGDFITPFGSGFKNKSIPILLVIDTVFSEEVEEVREEAKDKLLYYRFMKGISSLESLLDMDQEAYDFPWPADAINYIANKIFDGYTLIEAKKLVSKNQLDEMMEKIRSKLLNQLIEIRDATKARGNELKIEVLKRLKAEIENLKNVGLNSTQFYEWKMNVKVELARIFGDSSGHLLRFAQIKFTVDPDNLSFYSRSKPEAKARYAYQKGINESRELLDETIIYISKYGSENMSEEKICDSKVMKRKVFIIHGHDDALRAMVARVIERQGLEAIILHEQSNSGRTIIEKFEEYANSCDFAIALFTPDDLDSDSNNQDKFRARQNVLFELGFFYGKLGRKHTCVVKKGKIEIPSDLHGIVYVDSNSDDWRYQLVEELKATGFDVSKDRI